MRGDEKMWKGKKRRKVVLSSSRACECFAKVKVVPLGILSDLKDCVAWRAEVAYRDGR